MTEKPLLYHMVIPQLRRVAISRAGDSGTHDPLDRRTLIAFDFEIDPRIIRVKMLVDEEGEELNEPHGAAHQALRDEASTLASAYDKDGLPPGREDRFIEAMPLALWKQRYMGPTDGPVRVGWRRIESLK